MNTAPTFIGMTNHGNYIGFDADNRRPQANDRKQTTDELALSAINKYKLCISWSKMSGKYPAECSASADINGQTFIGLGRDIESAVKDFLKSLN